jgi:hypothetical protein
MNGDDHMPFINFKDIDHSDIVVEQNVSGDITDYDLSGFTCESFRQMLAAKNPNLDEKSSIEGLTKPVRLNTVRQLYEICRSSAPETKIFEDATAGDLLADRSNADENKTKFEGWKLLELRYYDVTPESQVVLFKYPYTEERKWACNFDVRMFISNPIVYNAVARMLYEYDRPILIYDYWRPAGRELLGTVENKSQIALL